MKACCEKNHCESACLCGCMQEHGGCGDQHHETMSMEEKAHIFMELADCAWMEVLKDKIKHHIKSMDDASMTELAKLIAEANKKRWKHKMDKNKCCHEFEGQLCDFFGKAKK